MYCLAGGRSKAAVDKLRNMGYNNVYELEGGTNAWLAANKPLEGNSNVKQIAIEELNIAINASRGDWVFSLDADERISSKLAKEIIKSIKEERANHDHNYDAMIGKVTNFSWTYNNSGYDIEIKLVGLGDIVESLKVNRTPCPIALLLAARRIALYKFLLPS